MLCNPLLQWHICHYVTDVCVSYFDYCISINVLSFVIQCILFFTFKCYSEKGSRVSLRLPKGPMTGKSLRTSSSLLGLLWQRTTDQAALATETYSLTLWRLKVQNQGVCRVCPFWGQSPRYVDGHLLLKSFTSSSLYACVYVQISPFYKDISHIGLDRTLMSSF